MFVQLFLFRSSLARLPGAPPRALSAGGAGLGLASMMRLAPPRSGQAARLRALACSSCARVALPACLAVFPSIDPLFDPCRAVLPAALIWAAQTGPGRVGPEGVTRLR
ncbi:unnamed protein product [Prorocentrum cordatum]|uniref:Secreted protein n=1 Tax=Prorocentrum cordatum TaxID=2364126 RepID=A0ABN9Q4V5_9DINO|nr:unnamed protein product [Polarella glacialis]